MIKAGEKVSKNKSFSNDKRQHLKALDHNKSYF
jgi:hypothetical protein